jgi:hypothetical protein
MKSNASFYYNQNIELNTLINLICFIRSVLIWINSVLIINFNLIEQIKNDFYVSVNFATIGRWAESSMPLLPLLFY